MRTDCVIICMKWGTLYGSDYVNVLYHACRRTTPRPFRFICLTDDSRDLDAGIESFAIPDIGLEARHYRGGGWPKFAVFGADLYGLTGRALFIDLDMVVLSDLGPLFDHTGRLITTDMGPNWQRKHGNGPPETGTSIFAFDLGREQPLLAQFQGDMDNLVARHGYEQTVIGVLAPSMDYWPPGWVISFKRHLRRGLMLDLLVAPAKPLADAKVLAFHGTPRPHELVQKGLWGRFPHLGRGGISWMVDYWRDNGGRFD